AHRPAPGETPLLKDLVRIAIATDGTIVECSQHVMVSSGFGFATLGAQGCMGSSCCAALYAQYASNILAAFTSGTPGLWRWNGAAWIQELYLGVPITGVTALGGNGDVVAALRTGADPIVARPAWTAMSPLPAGCIGRAVAVDAAKTVFVAGGC